MSAAAVTRAAVRQILLVDKDDLGRRQMKRLLEQSGFAVVEAASVDDAIRCLADGVPDALLCQVGTLDRDAFRLCARVRTNARLAEMPIVLMDSRQEGAADRALASTVGAAALVRHAPSDLQAVVDTLREQTANRDPKTARATAAGMSPSERLYVTLFDRATSPESIDHSSAVANIPGVLWSCRLDGTLRFMTSRASEILGASQAELVDERGGPDAWLARFHPDDRACVASSLRELAEEGTPLAAEVRYAHPSGRWMWLSAQAGLGIDEHGEPCIDGVFFDVTKRRELEAQVVHAQKLEALGHLTAAVAHDYNNVLAVILATSELLLEELEASSPLAEPAREIVAAAERGAALTKQLLATSRREAAERRNVDVNAVVRNVEPMVKRLLRHEIELELCLAPELGFVFADSGQLDQVIMNLAQNARDAMGGRGKVTIATANVEERGRRWVRLSFADTGSGMDAETCRKAFEPFFTTKGVKGTGLGLSTCQMIAKEHAGELRVESVLGVGTTFHLLLPHVSTPFVRGRVHQAGREVMLVVEDNERIREVTRRMLEASGHVVHVAADRAEAARLAAAHRNIDLILCDLLLGEETAVDVVGDVRRLVPNARLLVMSGAPKHPLLREAPLAGVTFLGKPFVAAGLEDAVRNAMSTPTLRHR